METQTESLFGMTENAASRIKYLRDEEKNPSLKFRIAVKGGGCSGFQYEFLLEEGPPAEGDTVIEKDGAQLVIDEVSLGILKGSVLDYTEDLSQAGFGIKNPNATARCGCGNSFSVNL